MTNQEIADIFDLLSKIMDLHGENSFKTKTYSTAAYRIEKLAQPLTSMDTAQLHSISGIGDAVIKKIQEILLTGKLSLLEDYIAKTPPGVLEMLSIKGIGPKKIALLWKELGLETIGELEYACNENRLITLKGFGAKTQAGIIKAISFMQQHKGFYLWAEAEAVANSLMARLQQQFPDNLISFTGSFRRQDPTLSCIEIVTDIEASLLMSQFADVPGATLESIAEGILVQLPNAPSLKFYLSEKKDFYRVLFQASAAPEFASAFAEQYTLPLQPESEQAIFAHNQLAFIPPALRETNEILALAAADRLPHLLQATDIRGIIHSHSTWSDGIHSLEEMAKAARDKGFEYLVISDHSQVAFYANGLSPERIRAQHAEVDKLNQQLAPFRIFKSIEADILSDGSLDYNEEILASFDLVIASIHSNLKMTEEKAMHRLLTAVSNPYVTILGHPTGRLLLSREGYPVNFPRLIDACVAHGVVIEINAHPRRLDLDWSWVSYALEKGAMLSVNPDAHSIEGMDMVQYGVLAAQKGGLTAGRNLSSFTLAEMEAFLAQRPK